MTFLPAISIFGASSNQNNASCSFQAEEKINLPPILSTQTNQAAKLPHINSYLDLLKQFTKHLGLITNFQEFSRGDRNRLFTFSSDKGTLLYKHFNHPEQAKINDSKNRRGDFCSIGLKHPGVLAPRYLVVENSKGKQSLIFCKKNQKLNKDQIVLGLLYPYDPISKDLNIFFTKDTTLEETRKVLKQVLEALRYLHKKGIVHRDIKPDNLLVVIDKNGNEIIKLIDFEFAAFIDRDKRPTSTCGTPGYSPPEQLEKSKPGDDRLDIFALGCLAWNLFTGGYCAFGEMQEALSNEEHKILSKTKEDLLLYQEKDCTFMEFQKQHIALSVYEKISSKLTQEFMDFLNITIHHNPSIRPCAEDLLNRPFFMTKPENQALIS